MKRIALLLAVFCVLCLVGCSNTQQSTNSESNIPDTPDNKALIAVVKEFNAGLTAMTVVGKEDNQEYRVNIEKMESTNEPEVGDTVQITYSGDVLETYPLQFQEVLNVQVIGKASDVLNLEFDVEYFRTNGYVEGEQYPKTFWITNVSELDEYIASASSQYDLGVADLAEGGTDFITHVKKYDKDFFETHDLIFVVLEEPSGSIRHTVTSVKAEMSILDRVEYFIQPYIERQVPEVGTDDMAEWHIIIEISKEYGAMYSDLKTPVVTE